jgi:hypothetical protein
MEGRKEGRKEGKKDGKKDGKKYIGTKEEGRGKAGRKEGRKVGRKEGWKEGRRERTSRCFGSPGRGATTLRPQGPPSASTPAVAAACRPWWRRRTAPATPPGPPRFPSVRTRPGCSRGQGGRGT